MNISELSAPLITLNQNLNPLLWNGSEELCPLVRDQLSSIVDSFVGDMGISSVEDALLTGSHAGFSWGPESSLIVTVITPTGDDDIYKELLEDRIAEWQRENPLKVGGYPLLISVVDSSVVDECGSYSLLENCWRTVPKRRAFGFVDVPVIALTESWNRRISTQNIESWIGDWRRLDQNSQDGSVEEKVVEALSETVNKLSRQTLGSLRPEPKRKDFIYGYHEEITEDAEPTPDGVNPTTCMFLNEKEVTPKADIVREFMRLCVKSLQIKNPPKVQLRRDPTWSARNKTFGRYTPGDNTMELSLANRNIMDICRTLAHELVHCRQNENGELGPDSGRDGSPQENEANSVAGDIMRKWGKLHPEFFTAENIGESSGYIPTKAQANDPRFVMALTSDVRPGATGKEANKLDLVTDKQGHPQIARADGKFERQLAESWQQFKEGQEEVPEQLIQLYDRMVKADHDANTWNVGQTKRKATLASKAWVKALNLAYGEDYIKGGQKVALAHKVQHGYDDLDDYLEGDQLDEGANDDYLWQARVKIKQAKYVGYIPVTVSAPDMRRARTLIASMYGVKDGDIGSTTKVKRK